MVESGPPAWSSLAVRKSLQWASHRCQDPISCRIAAPERTKAEGSQHSGRKGTVGSGFYFQMTGVCDSGELLTAPMGQDGDPNVMVGHKHNRPMTSAVALDSIKRKAAESKRPLTLRFRAPVLAPYDPSLAYADFTTSLHSRAIQNGVSLNSCAGMVFRRFLDLLQSCVWRQLASDMIVRCEQLTDQPFDSGFVNAKNTIPERQRFYQQAYRVHQRIWKIVSVDGSGATATREGRTRLTSLRRDNRTQGARTCTLPSSSYFGDRPQVSSFPAARLILEWILTGPMQLPCTPWVARCSATTPGLARTNGIDAV